MPAAVQPCLLTRIAERKGLLMTVVMIGVDPHKGSHTAVAIDAAETPLGELRVRASTAQAGKLLEWAAEWPERTWAVEGAGGLGHVLAQQLLAAGEQVLDVQPKLGARVRLLSSGTSNKNDPNDARSVAVAALRSPACQQVRADDHAVVLRVLSRRHRQLSSLRTQAACRLHAVLCEITPGGVPRNITANRAAAILGAHHPDNPAGQAWHDLAEDHLADLRRIDTKLSEARKKITVAVRTSGTTLTEIFGVGPVIAATVIGDVTDICRFPDADKFASYNGTAPIEVSSGSRKIYRLSMRGNRRLNHVIHMAAVTQIAHKNSDGHAYYQRKLDEGKTPSEARRALKRKISNAIYARLQADARARAAGPGDIRWDLLSSCLADLAGRAGEGGVLVVGLAGCQAVVQAAEEAAEQVALSGGVPVSGIFAPVVVSAGTG
jgi:transposase